MSQRRGIDVGDGAPGSQQGGAVYRLSPLGESFANGPLAKLALRAEANQDELAGLPAGGVGA